MNTAFTPRDLLFRKFQVIKFNKKNMVPTVTMTINVDVSHILKLKDFLNNENSNRPHITITHIITKVVADTLMQYPILYSFFNGKEIIENKELVLNIPVDVESHVEYITIRNPELKSLIEISKEFYKELNCIYSGNGTFMNSLLYFNEMSILQKMFYFLKPDGKMRFLREHYGIFPISNFGSFHINSGTVAISQPIIAALCIGSIACENERKYIPLTLSFDHRAVDGGYAGKFLHSVSKLLDHPESIISDRR